MHERTASRFTDAFLNHHGIILDERYDKLTDGAMSEAAPAPMAMASRALI